MKFTQGEIAEIYGFNWEQLVEEKDEGRMAYLRGKLDRLNNMSDIKYFGGDLDLRNQKNFKRVVRRKLEWFLEGEV